VVEFDNLEFVVEPSFKIALGGGGGVQGDCPALAVYLKIRFTSQITEALRMLDFPTQVEVSDCFYMCPYGKDESIDAFIGRVRENMIISACSLAVRLLELNGLHNTTRDYELIKTLVAFTDMSRTTWVIRPSDFVRFLEVRHEDTGN